MTTNKNDYDFIIKEITAGMVLVVKTDADKAWNNASLRAIRIINLYKEGKGLFQYDSNN